MLAAVNASDALMLGFLSQDALSAVSLAGQVQFVFNLFLGALTIGTSVLAAQYFGKGDRQAIEKIFAYVMRFAAIVSFVFFIATLTMPNLLMRIFTTEENLIADGAKYLRVVGVSYLMTGLSQIYLCVLKNTGHAIKSSIIGSVSVVLNIIINAVLIFGLWFIPSLGIVGAAVATVIAKAVELVWSVVESYRKDNIRLRGRYLFHSDKLLGKDFWKNTLPVLGNYLFWGIGFTMYSVITGHLGSDAVAANSIANIVKNLVACFCIGLGNGGGIIVGNELGRGDMEKAKSDGKKLCRIAVIAGVISGGVMLALSPLLLRVSNLTPQATEYLQWLLIMCAVYMLGKSINMMTIAGIFMAGGDAKFGLICDTVTMWAVTVPLGFLAAFVFKWPIFVVFVIINSDEIIKLPAVWLHYRKYKWVKNLTRDAENVLAEK